MTELVVSDKLREKIPITIEVVKEQYAKATISVMQADTRLRNARARQATILRSMRELGYVVMDPKEVTLDE